MGRKNKNQEQSDNDSEDDDFKPKKTTKSRKLKTISNSTSPKKSQPQKRTRNSLKNGERNNLTKSQNSHQEESTPLVNVNEKESNALNEFCPICQVPLSILKITPANHTANCNIPANLPGILYREIHFLKHGV